MILSFVDLCTAFGDNDSEKRMHINPNLTVMTVKLYNSDRICYMTNRWSIAKWVPTFESLKLSQGNEPLKYLQLMNPYMSSREEFQKYTQEINSYASLSDNPLNYLQVINPWSIPKWQSLEVSIKLKHLNHPQVVMNPWSIAKWHLRSIQRRQTNDISKLDYP